METLRTELIESQKARMNLMKWKLIIIAAVGAAGLGFSGGANTISPNAPLALAVLPLACVYVDLLCRHLSLRNKAIGQFIATGAHADVVLRDYERFYAQISLDAWKNTSFESIALRTCTTLVSVAVIPLGILASGVELSFTPEAWPAVLFVVSGLAGVLSSEVLDRRYRLTKEAVKATPPSAA